MNGIQKTPEEAKAYAIAMEDLHGEKWLPFIIPAGTMARKFGKYGCCKASERAIYEEGGAQFI